MDANLERRLDRLESAEAIRQLAANYARYVDTKELQKVADLYVEDVVVGEERGRDAKVRALVNNHGGPGRFGTTIHLISSHSVDWDEADADRATGVLYCRAEHEIGELWVIATIQYDDVYVRRDGSWLFESRTLRAFYVVDVLQRPNGEPIKQRLTNFGVLEVAELPGAWPSWEPFWAEQGRDPHTPA